MSEDRVMEIQLKNKQTNKKQKQKLGLEPSEIILWAFPPRGIKEQIKGHSHLKAQ